jgi:dTDP-4-amino-4,6-dideoxygalactose transaminase
VDEGEVPLWAEVACAGRDQVAARLVERGIRTVPYPPCLADSPHLCAEGEFPNAERFGERGLVLPCGTHQLEENLERVLDALHEIAPEVEG